MQVIDADGHIAEGNFTDDMTKYMPDRSRPGSVLGMAFFMGGRG